MSIDEITEDKPKIVRERIPQIGSMPFLTLANCNAKTATGEPMGKKDFSISVKDCRAESLGDLSRFEIAYIGPASDIPIPEIKGILAEELAGSWVVWFMDPSGLTTLEYCDLATVATSAEVISIIDPEHGHIRPCPMKDEHLISKIQSSLSVPHNFTQPVEKRVLH